MCKDISQDSAKAAALYVWRTFLFLSHHITLLLAKVTSTKEAAAIWRVTRSHRQATAPTGDDGGDGVRGVGGECAGSAGEWPTCSLCTSVRARATDVARFSIFDRNAVGAF